MKDTSREIARELLKINAVFLRPNEPFTWASGIKSPIYCDNRLILSAPMARAKVERAMAEMIRAEYPQCEVLAGTATAGIAHAALVADILNIPMCYVRSAAKDHGRENLIEGRAEPGQKVVVVEDLISTGGSVLDTVDVLRNNGCTVLGIASIFTYGLEAGKEKLAKKDVKNASLSNYDVLIEEAVAQKYIDEADLPKLRAFQANPRDESWMEL